LGLDPARLTAGQVGYIIAPKLNAANRVGDPRVAFLLLTTESRPRAEYLAETLIDYNRDRQIAQDDLLYQAEELIRGGAADPRRDKIIILEGDYWNPGIIGLVASTLAERYYRPTILISRGERESRASGRSIPEFDLIAGLERFNHLFMRYGGHQMAAGFSIANRNIPPLKEGLHEYTNERLAGLDGPTSRIDTPLEPEEIGLKLYEEIQRLAPFGMGNPEPRFLLPRARLSAIETVGSGGEHLKCRAEAGGRELECIGFGLGRYAARLGALAQTTGTGDEVGLVFKLSRDEWLGRVRVQLELEDFVQVGEF
ncbi:MAG: DHHA1 domain-containing protein, partial [Candidatus Bipolaricaulia bacterium]